MHTLPKLLISSILMNTAICILTPIMTEQYESIYFILLMTTLQLCIITFIAYTINKTHKPTTTNNRIPIIIGLFDATTSICMLYSSNPNRTPIIIQVILSNTTIIPSAFFTKYILKKHITYDYKYIISSLILLTISIILTVLTTSTTSTTSKYTHSPFWTLMYFTSTICGSAYAIYQEKYMTHEKNTNRNKLNLMLTSESTQILILLTLFWLEYLIGYTNSPYIAFKHSFTHFLKPTNFLLMELLILIYILNYIIGINLNTISTNYNMISITIVGPLTILFFKIFTEFDSTSTSTYNTFTILICSITSTILWIMGEKHEQNESHPLQTNKYPFYTSLDISPIL